MSGIAPVLRFQTLSEAGQGTQYTRVPVCRGNAVAVVRSLLVVLEVCSLVPLSLAHRPMLLRKEAEWFS